MSTAGSWALGWQIVAVAAGAALGAILRWWASLQFNPLWHGFPLGTWAVNLVGGLLIGMALVVFERVPNDGLRLLLVTGLLGGLTTFSAFTGESLALLQRGDYAMALAHTLAHVVGSLVCATLGFRFMRFVMA